MQLFKINKNRFYDFYLIQVNIKFKIKSEDLK